MMSITKEMGLLPAMMDFFGKKPDQSLADFKKEMDQLTPQDKEEIKTGLIANGYNIRSA